MCYCASHDMSLYDSVCQWCAFCDCIYDTKHSKYELDLYYNCIITDTSSIVYYDIIYFYYITLFALRIYTYANKYFYLTLYYAIYTQAIIL